MKITLIKEYKLNNVNKKKGLHLEVTNELGSKLIEEGYAIKFGEKIPEIKPDIKKKYTRKKEDK